MILHDEIGLGYANHRRPDKSVTTALLRHSGLAPGDVVVDVGAGTGGYARALADAGLCVRAVEPSAVMRAQSLPHRGVTMLAGSADHLPLRSASARAATCILSMNHFPDLVASQREIDRVTGRGCVLVVTVDSREADRYWLTEYFPTIVRYNLRRVPPVAELRARLASLHQREVSVFSLPVPRDFSDLFFGAAWSRPELMLEPDYRRSSSSFAHADSAQLSLALETLARHLSDGTFWRRHAGLQDRETLDVGLRLLRVAPDV